MIKSELKLNYKNNKPMVTQRVLVICEDCQREYDSRLYNQIRGLDKYGRDLCVGCKQKEQIKLGIRGIQYINAGLASIKSMKGKTHVELYGEDKAEDMRKINSEKNSGKNNKNYGGTWHGTLIDLNGKTLEEIHGKEKSDIIKRKISFGCSGEKNGMFGKPSPSGSGNGWSGWYKDMFFKSLLELSFLINYVDKFNMKCKSAEKKEFRMKYIDFEEKVRNYFADFIINDQYMIEIKPEYLRNSFINKRKKEAAVLFCNDNNLKYKMITPPRLTNKEIKNLIESGQVVLIDRYKEKYNIWCKNQIKGQTTSG